jgi:tetraacyldisaccharide 4'-kinase
MIQTLRYIIFAPLSLIFGVITGIRNFLYDKSLLNSFKPDISTICIGNLAVGGTGKTPHTEYFIRLLKDEYRVALLSRGYKRKTTGFRMADKNADFSQIGDEPMQVFRKFGNQVKVFVGEDRKNSIKKIQQQFEDVDLILLDDAFQHRKIRAGLNIVVSAYNQLFWDDYWMPSGNLRESGKGIRRADLLIISKCPSDISEMTIHELTQRVGRYTDIPIYFSTIRYGQIYSLQEKQTDTNTLNQKVSLPAILLVAGIVDPSGIKKYLAAFTDKIEVAQFRDHHQFRETDFVEIARKFHAMPDGSLIITTEKDAARLYDLPWLSKELKQKIYVLPIEIDFLPTNEIPIDQKIKAYVEKNRKNC